MGAASEIKKIKYVKLYMDIAKRVALMSHCERTKVGSVIVKDGRIISMGWNGTPSGQDNCCEVDNVTKPEVLHAESNALMKLARFHESGEGAILYNTLSPCMDCAKMIYQAGIKIVYFNEFYRDDSGIDALERFGVNTIYTFPTEVKP